MASFCAGICPHGATRDKRTSSCFFALAQNDDSGSDAGTVGEWADYGRSEIGTVSEVGEWADNGGSEAATPVSEAGGGTARQDAESLAR